MKKLALVVLTVLLLVVLVTGVSANENFYDFEFRLSEDGSYYILCWIPDYDDDFVITIDIVIPSEYNGLPVREIYLNAFSYHELSGSLIIPDSITAIGSGAFDNCSVSDCDLVIGSGVTTIANDAFDYCDSFKSITVSDKNPVYHSDGNCLIETATKKIIKGSNNSIIPSDGSVISIGKFAFYECTLETIIIPECVSTIEEYAFRNSDLRIVNLPYSVSEIGSNAFYSKLLSKATIERADVSFGSDVFYHSDVTIYSYANSTAEKYANENNLNFVDVDAGRELIDSGECRDNLTWSLYNDGELVISGEGAMEDWKQWLPAPWVSYKRNIYSIKIESGVTSIGDYAFYDEYKWIESISIPSTVEDIGRYAFAGCTLISGDLIIPEGVKTIGGYAFRGCNRIDGNLYIPGSVESIGDEAFFLMTSITGISVGENNAVYHSSGNCLIETSTKTLIKGSNNCVIPEDDSIVIISDYAFFGCEELTGDLIIPDSVEYIGESAFSGCSGLNGKIYLGENIVEIKEGAFYNCSGLTGDLIIPDSVEYIGESAFSGCSGFNGALIIPASVETIVSASFNKCVNIQSIVVDTKNSFYHSSANCLIETESKTLVQGCVNSVIPSDGSVQIISYGAFAFLDRLPEEFVIPEGVTQIEGGAFYSCLGLKGDLVIPNSVEHIGGDAFSFCYRLNGALTIGENVNKIDSRAFYYCNKLTGDLVIPDSVEFIGEKAFTGCIGRNLIIGDGVTYIYGIFTYCVFSGDLVIGDGVTEIYYKTFDYSFFFGDLVIGKNVIEIGFSAFADCGGFTGDLIIPDSVEYIGESAFSGCNGFTGDLIIPDSVEYIGESAFSGCSGLNGKIYLGENIVEIKERAFYNCSSLTGDLIIPDSVEYIGDYAFSKCSGLNGKIYLGENIVEIKEGAFYNCSSLTGDLIIPDSVEYIGDYAFSKCSGRNLIIGDGVTELGNSFQDVEFTGDLVIGAGITVIPSQAFSHSLFSNDKNFTGELIIGENVVEIGFHAFDECGFTGDLIIPDGVKKIGNYAFGRCSGFNGKLVLGSSLVQIGENAFLGCSGFVGDLVIPESVEIIGDQAFEGCKNFRRLILNDGLIEIGRYTFADCSGFTGDLIIPDSVTTLLFGAFKNCTGFNGDLIIGNRVSLKLIGESAFKGCTGFSGDLIIGDSVTDISYYQFNDLENIKRVFLPVTVERIECSEFMYYVNLEGVYYKGTLKQWKEIEIKNSHVGPITRKVYYYSKDVPDFEDGNTYWHYLFGEPTVWVYYPYPYTFEIVDETYALITGYTGDGGDVVIPENIYGYPVEVIAWNSFKDCTTVMSVTMPDSVREIGLWAFKNCTNLVSVQMPDTLYELNDSLFENCTALMSFKVPTGSEIVPSGLFKGCTSLENVILHDGITSIGESAFAGCTSLATIELPSSLNKLGASAFSGCTALSNVKLNAGLSVIEKNVFKGCTALTNIMIPDSITEIGVSSFENCSNLTAVDFSANLAKICDSAFKNCGLKDEIMLPSTVASIGRNSFILNKLSSVYFLGDAPTVMEAGSNTSSFDDNVTLFYMSNNSGWLDSNAFNETNSTWNGYRAKTFKIESGRIIEQCVIKIFDHRTNLPLEGVRVELDGNVGVSDVSGFVSVNKPTAEKAKLSLSREDYVPLDIEEYTVLPFDVVIIYPIDIKDIIPLKCNDEFLNTGIGRINTKANLTAKISVKGQSLYDILRYELFQGNTLLAVSYNGNFSVHNSKFYADGSPVIVRMYTSDGLVTEKELNFAIVAFTLDGFVPDFLKNDQGNEKLVGAGGKIDFELPIKSKEKYKIEVEVNNTDIKIGINMSVKNKDLPELTGHAKAMWEDMMESIPQTGLSFELGGYIKIELGGSKGDIHINKITSYSMIGAKTNMEFPAGPVWVLFIPVCVDAEISGEGCVEIRGWGYDFENAKIVWPNELKFKADIELTAGVAIGVSKLKAGVYGKSGGELELTVLPKIYLDKVLVKGELGVYGVLGWFEAHVPLIKGEYILYERRDKQSLYIYQANNYISSIYETDSYTLLDRSYLDERSEWNSEGTGVLQSSVYSGIDPQIITCGDVTIMVYLDDTGGGDNYNYQKLVYSTWNGSGWETPKRVINNSLNDFEFDLYSDGENIWIAYTESNRENNAEDDIISMVSTFDINVVKYDVDSNSFSEPYSLTNDTYYDTYPQITAVNGEIVVAWVRNNDNNPFCLTDNNTIYMCSLSGDEWGMPSVISENLSAIMDFDIGEFNSEAVLAAVIDTNNDLINTEDTVVSLYMPNGLTETYGLICSSVEFDEDKLYVLADNGLYSLTCFDGDMVLETSNVSSNITDDFKIVKNSANTSIVYGINNSEGDNGGSDLLYISNNNGEWTSPVKIKFSEGYADSFDVVDLNGELLSVYLKTEPTFTEEDFAISCDLCSEVVRNVPYLNIKEIDFSEYDLLYLDSVTFEISVTNNGIATANGFSVIIGGSYVVEYFDSVQPGETVCVIVEEYSIPECESETLVSIEYENETVAAETVVLRRTDFSVTVEAKIIGDIPYASVIVENIGNAYGSGMLKVRINNSDGEIIYTENVNLVAGESGYVLIPIEDNSIYRVHAEIIPENDDIFDWNNTDMDSLFRPASSTGGVAVSGCITSYNPRNETRVELMQDGETLYAITISASSESDSITQWFEISGVAEGTYDLVVTKAGHLKYTITGVVVGGADIDLSEHSNEEIADIRLISGDINSDGCIDLKDVVELTSDLVYGKTYGETDKQSADVNGDECFDLKDLVIITSETNYGKAETVVVY